MSLNKEEQTIFQYREGLFDSKLEVRVPVKYRGHYPDFVIVDNDRLEELKKHTWYLNKGGYAYTNSKGLPGAYVTRTGFSITYLHHFLMGNRVKKGYQIDHRNTNRFDYRMENLKEATVLENQRNKNVARIQTRSTAK